MTLRDPARLPTRARPVEVKDLSGLRTRTGDPFGLAGRGSFLVGAHLANQAQDLVHGAFLVHERIIT
jgi:hypothetical protein